MRHITLALLYTVSLLRCHYPHIHSQSHGHLQQQQKMIQLRFIVSIGICRQLNNDAI